MELEQVAELELMVEILDNKVFDLERALGNALSVLVNLPLDESDRETLRNCKKLVEGEGV